MKRSHWMIGLALVVIVVASAAAQPPSQPGMGDIMMKYGKMMEGSGR